MLGARYACHCHSGCTNDRDRRAYPDPGLSRSVEVHPLTVADGFRGGTKRTAGALGSARCPGAAAVDRREAIPLPRGAVSSGLGQAYDRCRADQRAIRLDNSNPTPATPGGPAKASRTMPIVQAQPSVKTTRTLPGTAKRAADTKTTGQVDQAFDLACPAPALLQVCATGHR